MRNCVLYIAMSLDGYIAAENGAVNWLGGDNSDEDNLGTYNEFIEGVDTVVMGYNTYHQIVTELSPDEWVYAGKQSYVVTSKEISSIGEIKFVSQDPALLVKELKKQSGQEIWICGGARIASALIEADMVDRYHISVIPTILGKGIKLFSEYESEKKLRLIKTVQYNGIVDLVYERRD